MSESAVAGGGPDVAVSVIGVNSPSQPGNGFGNVNGISAFAIATTSCNVGTANLQWVMSSPNHPVIAQNMYRYLDGRFEQIGMAWVKHGFLATNDTDGECGTCDHPGVTSRLGPGCSDLYTAGLNADRTGPGSVPGGGLGPRSQVNAFTGVFPFPNLESPEDTEIDGRLQVHNSDLDAALNVGARYLVEGHYVASDDAAVGNADNNASWRPVAFHYDEVNDRYLLSWIDNEATRQQEAAIWAWQEFDPGVQIVPVRVPGEGLFYVACRATSLGTGFWRYHYAVQNLNSHRSAGSFRVPIPANAIVQNVGFHDVDYHTGEPYDGTDWAVTVTDDSISWSTDPFEEYPNANALRWSTLYSFRFDINVEPVSTVVVLGMFRTGGPMEVPAQAIGPLLALVDCNDNAILDTCDVDCGPIGGECDVPGCGLSIDCNGNGVPDECETDCNDNGLADSCDLLNETSLDCNLNTVPDECDPDCDDDGLPDDCDGSDQDMDGVIDCDDRCPATSPPGSCVCPDVGACCQPAGGFCASFLPDLTQVPGCDCCRPGDGICFLEVTRDACHTIPGAFFECEGTPCRDGCLIGDTDLDGDYDLVDIGGVQNCFSASTEDPGFTPPSEFCLRIVDQDGDGDVDDLDFAHFVAALVEK